MASIEEDQKLGERVYNRLEQLLIEQDSGMPGPWHNYWQPWNELYQQHWPIVQSLLGQAIHETLSEADIVVKFFPKE